MPNELDPRIDQWYAYIGKEQPFYVTTVNEEESTIDIQHFDGDLEELSLDEWRDLVIELIDEPEDWRGALDVADEDDQSTEVNTKADDWSELGEA